MGGKSIEEKFPSPGQFRVRSHRLAIAPATHPDTDLQLVLEDDLQLRKTSYVCTETPKQIPVNFLRRMEDGHRRLTPKSYERLRHCISFPIPEGFQCLDRNAATLKASDTKSNFDDQGQYLLDSNNVRAKPASPQVSPHSPPLLAASNSPHVPWYWTESTRSQNNVVRAQPPSRTVYSSFRNVIPIQDSWYTENTLNPGVTSHSRRYCSTTTVLPTVERPVADKDDGSGDTWTFGSILRTATVLLTITALVYVGKRMKW